MAAGEVQGIEFTPSAGDRIAATVKRSEATSLNHPAQRPNLAAPSQPGVFFAKITNEKDGEGNYPATIARLDPDDYTNELLGQVVVRSLNGESLTEENIYSVRRAGFNDAGTPLYQALRGDPAAPPGSGFDLFTVPTAAVSPIHVSSKMGTGFGHPTSDAFSGGFPYIGYSGRGRSQKLTDPPLPTTGGTWLRVIWPSSTTDSRDWVSSNQIPLDGNLGRILAALDGLYLVGCWVSFSATSESAGIRGVRIVHNGDGKTIAEQTINGDFEIGQPVSVNCVGPCIVQGGAGVDYFYCESYVLTPSGVAVTILEGTFWIMKLG
jgi:hypothetical protein